MTLRTLEDTYTALLDLWVVAEIHGPDELARELWGAILRVRAVIRTLRRMMAEQEAMMN